VPFCWCGADRKGLDTQAFERGAELTIIFE
jgi:hypothetical protein